MKVYVDGKDTLGWHLDVERQHLTNALDRLGFDTISFISDLRFNTDGASFIVDVGEDLGAPGSISPNAQKAMRQLNAYFNKYL